MADLSHWDFADFFTAHEIAALVAGELPDARMVHEETWETNPILRRIVEDFEAAKRRIDFDGPGIYSRSLEALSAGKTTHSKETKEWLAGPKGEIERQVFDRTEVARWLGANQLTSVYAFDNSTKTASEAAPDASRPEVGHWPWGKHHTELLGHLEAAARRFWTGYDPTDPTTANTNATVIEWLEFDRKVSRKMAQAIATMLRPDGLRTGPR